MTAAWPAQDNVYGGLRGIQKLDIRVGEDACSGLIVSAWNAKGPARGPVGTECRAAAARTERGLGL